MLVVANVMVAEPIMPDVNMVRWSQQQHQQEVEEEYLVEDETDEDDKDEAGVFLKFPMRFLLSSWEYFLVTTRNSTSMSSNNNKQYYQRKIFLYWSCPSCSQDAQCATEPTYHQQELILTSRLLLTCFASASD